MVMLTKRSCDEVNLLLGRRFSATSVIQLLGSERVMLILLWRKDTWQLFKPTFDEFNIVIQYYESSFNSFTGGISDRLFARLHFGKIYFVYLLCYGFAIDVSCLPFCSFNVDKSKYLCHWSFVYLES